VEEYSSARQDIMRALQARLENKHAPRNKTVGIIPGKGGNGGGPNGGNGGRGPPNDASRARRARKADSVPPAVIVLAAIAGFLLLLGGAGFFARRLQARRVLRPAQSPGRPPSS